MARLPRLIVPGYPHHLIQRGNNRQPIFVDTDDQRRLLGDLGECAQRFGVAVHAYVLMSNHFHVLATPEDEGGLSAMMQAVGRRYVRLFNGRHGRTGTLWEGRFKGTVIDSERYLIACMAYMDLNPVRAGIVPHPADYGWSSYGHYAGMRHDPLITPHSLYWSLGNTPFSREAAYRQLVEAGLSHQQVDDFTDATLKGWALGDDAFMRNLQEQTGRRVAKQKAGRPFGKL